MNKHATVRIAIIFVSIFLLLLVFIVWITANHPNNSSYWPDGFHRDLAPDGTDEAFSSESGQANPQEVNELLVKWASGNILIQQAAVQQIEFHCIGSVQDPEMYWYQSGNKLTIEFTKKNVFFGLEYTSGSKDLLITVPKNWSCKALTLQVASADVQINTLRVEELKFQSASGVLTVDSCTLNSLEADTASGNIYFSGTAVALECNSASADLIAILNDLPRTISMESISGDLDVTLPQDAGFTVKIGSLSGQFSSDFPTALKNGRYYFGDGLCQIEANSMSGDVFIRKR